MRVVSLEDGLSKERKVVAVRHQEHNTILTIILHVPDVVLLVDRDPVVLEHEADRPVLLALVAVHEDHALLDNVIRVASSFDNLCH